MAVDPAYLTLLKTRLAEAQQAYHDLMTGGSARVYVDQNAERVEYTAANKANLWAYINGLLAEICRLDPSDPICMMNIGRASGPAGFVF